jgi:hypothetical protein
VRDDAAGNLNVGCHLRNDVALSQIASTCPARWASTVLQSTVRLMKMFQQQHNL